MNNDLSVLFKCRKTVIELLRDRKFDVPLLYECSDESEFYQLYQAKRLDIFVKEPKKCYVKFVILNKARPQLVREYIADIKKKFTGEEGDIIIVLKNKPHNSLFKITKEFNNIQIFWLDELINNITHHVLNPKFTLLTLEEENKLLAKLNLCTKLQLPVILSSDPISKYFNYKNGDICRIERNSITNGSYISFRCVR